MHGYLRRETGEVVRNESVLVAQRKYFLLFSGFAGKVDVKTFTQLDYFGHKMY